jgi:hypothetical protein
MSPRIPNLAPLTFVFAVDLACPVPFDLDVGYYELNDVGQFDVILILGS